MERMIEMTSYRGENYLRFKVGDIVEYTDEISGEYRLVEIVEGFIVPESDAGCAYDRYKQVSLLQKYSDLYGAYNPRIEGCLPADARLCPTGQVLYGASDDRN